MPKGPEHHVQGPSGAPRPHDLLATSSIPLSPPREALRRQLLPAEQDEDAEGMCKPLSCGWEITDTLCVGPVFTPASIM